MPASITLDDLGAIQLFRGERPETYGWLLDVAAERTLLAGEVLLAPGRENTQLFFILDGELRVELQLDGRPEITRLGPGECAGELSVLDHELTSAYVIADGAARVMGVDRRYIWQLINTSHAVARNLLVILSSKVRQDNHALGQSLLLQRHYEQHSRIDALTGLRNRFWLEEMQPRLVERAHADGVPLGLILLDVDRFKGYNDDHGHLAGDQALRTLGATLLQVIRPNDAAVRVGGEEFMVLLPGAGERECRDIAERVCEAIRQQPIRDHEARELPGITVSMGVAVLAEGDDALRLYAAADRALYQAKGAGRDRVMFADRGDAA
jgi:diguanylate cyclase (GGDEF)-like protein